MDLKQLEYFVMVAELGSFTKASQQLKVAQPALSRQVQQLEAELGQPLLTRNGRGAIATEAGRILVEYAKGILHQVERAKEEVGKVGGAKATRVSIGLPSSVAKVLTVPLTRAFRKALPGASLSVTEGLTTALQEALIAGRLDIALLYNATAVPELRLVPLLYEELYWVQQANPAKKKVCIGQSISLAEVSRQPIIIPTRPNAIRNLVESQMSEINASLTIFMEIDGVNAILDLIAEGIGSAVLPMNAILTAPKPERYAMRRIRGLKSQLVLATSAQRPGTSTQTAMQLLITDLAAQYIDAS
jgi:LysR family transcriptional regulator, nitrogen assimilation regulatory protein